MKLSYPVVAVYWDDAHINTDDVRRNTIEHEPYAMVTVGLLIRQDKRGVTLASEYVENDPDDLRTTQFMPRKMVRRIVRL